MEHGMLTRRDIEETFGDGFRFGENFVWGVGNSAYQAEGGINGPGEPLNNWAPWEASGKAERTGGAARFYDRYGDDFGNTSKMGLSHFRMSLEWARVQPSFAMGERVVPEFDREVIEHYAQMANAARENGLEPVLTLHHFTHPMWLGADMWLERDNLELFENYVRFVVEEINSLLVSRYGAPPISIWETTNEPTVVSSSSYLFRAFPAQRGPGLKQFIEALNNQLIAHVIAYECINEIYEKNGWAKPMVTFASVSLSLYWMDLAIFEILLAKGVGVEREGLYYYLLSRSSEFHRMLSQISQSGGAKVKVGREIEDFLDWLIGRVLGEELFSPFISRVYSSAFDRLIDFVSMDFYDPFIGHYWKLPTVEEIKEVKPKFDIQPWQWIQNPSAFRQFLKYYSASAGIPIHVFENGICNRVKGGKALPRKDGWERPEYLKVFLFEMARAKKEGAKVEGYFHWAITDNYEWGSFEPRFGLFGIEYENDSRRMKTDSMGKDAAGTYARIADSLANGSMKEIERAFLGP